jgi:hypothetical protein
VSEWVSECAIEKVDCRHESELLCDKLTVFHVIMDFFTVYGLQNIIFLFTKKWKWPTMANLFND